MFKTKRGLSVIVTTVSLVLLTFAAAAIVYNFAIPFVQNNLESSGSCLPYGNYFEFETDYGVQCYRSISPPSDTKLYGISVKANSADEEDVAEIKGMKLAFSGQAISGVADIFEGRATSGGEDGVWMSDASQFEIPKNGEVRTYIYQKNQTFDRVEVHPVLKSGKVCEASDSIRILGACSSEEEGAVPD